MAKPWIGIPTRFNDSGQATGKIRLYLEPVLWAGGLPVMIPIFVPLPVAREYFKHLDGILLPGNSSDIDPVRYGQDPHPCLGKIVPERDDLDFALLEYSERERLPVFGICFGAQSLNVFRGGTLVQDIPSIVTDPVFHTERGEPPVPARHLVQLRQDSLVGLCGGTDSAEVNSFHHQSVAGLGSDLRVTATAPDGVIEAIEDPGERFVVGVQWHPEQGFQDDPFSKALFTAFIQEAAKSKDRSAAHAL